MPRILLLFFLSVTLIISTSCISRKERDMNRIAELEKAHRSSIPQDTSIAHELVFAYRDFTENYRLDTTSAEYLLRLGSICMNLNQPKTAQYYFRQLTSRYPHSYRAAYGWFLQAFVTENYLKQNKEAIYLYDQFLKRYPNHELSDDAANAGENLKITMQDMNDNSK